jgi:hypothetical protein
MIDAAILRRLAALQLPTEAFQEVLAIIADASADSSADSAAMRRRERDREYQKTKRLQRKTGKQTMSGVAHESADESADCEPTLLDSVVSSTEEQVKILPIGKQKKEARGSRITRDSVMPDECRKFALEYHRDPDAAWAEFVDYWVGVPGARGLKLDWPATFRNRIRHTNGGSNGTYRNGGATGGREGGHRSWASFALAEARKASEKNG